MASFWKPLRNWSYRWNNALAHYYMAVMHVHWGIKNWLSCLTLSGPNSYIFAMNSGMHTMSFMILCHYELQVTSTIFKSRLSHWGLIKSLVGCIDCDQMASCLCYNSSCWHLRPSVSSQKSVQPRVCSIKFTEMHNWQQLADKYKWQLMTQSSDALQVFTMPHMNDDAVVTPQSSNF